MNLGDGFTFENVTFSWDTMVDNVFEKNKILPKIKKVIFHKNIATEVIWMDGTKTKVEVGKNDLFSPEYGLAMAIAKKYCGNYENFSKSLKKAKYR
jgi:hypothetical protein